MPGVIQFSKLISTLNFIALGQHQCQERTFFIRAFIHYTKRNKNVQPWLSPLQSSLSCRLWQQRIRSYSLSHPFYKFHSFPRYIHYSLRSFIITLSHSFQHLKGLTLILFGEPSPTQKASKLSHRLRG